MSPEDYRAMLVECIETGGGLTLVGRGGLGARGELVSYTKDGEAIRIYSADDAAKMLRKFDAAASARSDGSKP